MLLAALGQADATVIAALLGRADAAAVAQDLAQRPQVYAQGDVFTIAPGAAAAILADVEQRDLPRYRWLHERAVAHLSSCLRAGDAAAEPPFLAAFECLANRLLLDDPSALAKLTAASRDVPLASASGRQRRSYFEGLALAKTDHYADALAVFEALLAEPGLDPAVRGRTLNSHANCCRITGRLEAALAGYQASLELWRQLGNRLREGMALHNMAIVAYQLQQYEDAERDLHAAMDCFLVAGATEWLAAARNELGLVYRDQGRWAEALDRFAAAVSHYRAAAADDPLGRALNNIGEVLLFQGRLAEAEAAFQSALAAMRTRIYAVDTHMNLGLARQVAGDIAGALAAFRAALELALAIGRRDTLAQVHYRLGEALAGGGDDDGAMAQLAAAAAVIEATRAPLRNEDLKISLLGRWQQIYEALVLRCLACGRLREAFAWAERSRARAFADAVFAARARAAAANRLGLRKTRSGEHSRLMLAASKLGPRRAPRRLAIHVLRSLPTVAEIQASLPSDTALLCYFTTGLPGRDLPLLRALPADSPLRAHLLTPARTLLFVLTNSGIAAHECPIDPNAFASASPRGSDERRFLAPEALRRLGAALLAPAGDALTARRLYIVPHGPLHHVPFGALTNERGAPLIRADGPLLAYAPSATVLLRHCLAARPLAPSPGDCLAVGFDGEPGAHALRHTEAEARFVARMTGGTALIGPAPKGALLRQAAASRRWLHFACHGRFDPDAPLESWLETGAGERLTALEVLRKWELQADLAILSACQSGVSRILRGDEPMGLVRAFLYAGARALLVSQWPVEDLPTFLLMWRCYHELQHASPAAALQTAQIWLRELTAGAARTILAHLAIDGELAHESATLADLPPDARPFAHPRCWAAFVLIGPL